MSSKPPLLVHCPVCETEIDYYSSEYRPFCSQRCQLIDLGDWAAEQHRIAGDSVNPDDIDTALENLKN